MATPSPPFGKTILRAILAAIFLGAVFTVPHHFIPELDIIIEPLPREVQKGGDLNFEIRITGHRQTQPVDIFILIQTPRHGFVCLSGDDRKMEPLPTGHPIRNWHRSFSYQTTESGLHGIWAMVFHTGTYDLMTPARCRYVPVSSDCFSPDSRSLLF